MKTRLICAVIVSLSLLVLPAWVAAGAAHEKPELVLQVIPYDIAATIAAYLDIKPPSGSVGTPLVEVLHASK